MRKLETAPRVKGFVRVADKSRDCDAASRAEGD